MLPKLTTDVEQLPKKAKDIAEVLKNSTESFEKYLNNELNEEFETLSSDLFPDVRLDNLDKLLVKLRTSLKLTAPCVDEANEMVSQLNLLNSKIELIKEKMKGVCVSNDFPQLCELERKISDNFSKLKCVEKLKTHFNPLIFSELSVNLDEDDYDQFVQIIKSAENLKNSREFCHSLKDAIHDSEVPSLSEALNRMDEKFEKVSEMCYSWLTKQTEKISVLSSRATLDSGIINEPLINVCDRDDNIGIVSIFETNPTTRSHSSDKMERSDKAEEEEKISLRMLKILILSPTILERFLNITRDFLSELSYRRFTSLLKFIKPEVSPKNNAIYDVFMNLQLVLSLVKSCVISLYTNCELDLYRNPFPNLEILNAPNYIDKIASNLVPPLEEKLDRILDEEKTSQTGLEPVSNSLTTSSVRYQSSITSGSNDGAETSDDSESIYVVDILDLYAAIQICRFYYNKISNILKPPYLHPYLPSPTGFELDKDIGYDHENSAILSFFNTMCSKWNEMIVTKLQQNITVPLSNNEISKKLKPDHVVETISSFLSEIVSIQLEYSVSDDLLMILQMTINPVINWCRKVSNDLGESSHFFLISSFSNLLSSIQSPLVNKSFKLLLEDLIDNSIEVLVQNIVELLIPILGGKVVDFASFTVEFTDDSFLDKIKAVVYMDSILKQLPEDLSKNLQKMDQKTYRQVCKRVYLFIATVYKQCSSDEKRSEELMALASYYT